ncbi:MAG: 3-deoxy-manno-octulosonate cytidylyltransferase [Gammaproteobacteria bacterium]|nr:3-deoxy-manno-octulosonate cytidylyltransferase [Gammaproteobacteria bacterium]
MYRVVIPARYAATRLPGKPLVKIQGRPLIQWVYERARASRAAEVLIATDDERIAEVATGFGAAVAMTSILHASGTDRIAEVAAQRGWADADVVVNLQGDEPLMPEALIDQAAGLLENYPGADIGTLAARIGTLAAYMDPNVVKLVTGADQRALYFSRAPIPWHRDAAPAGLASQRSYSHARRHVGIYAYRCGALRRLAAIAPTPLEQLEKLEQLRPLEHGFDIRVADAGVLPGPDVNTAEDVARVEALLAQ